MRGGLIETGLDFAVRITEPFIANGEALVLVAFVRRRTKFLHLAFDLDVLPVPVSFYTLPVFGEPGTKSERTQVSRRGQTPSQWLPAQAQPPAPRTRRGTIPLLGIALRLRPAR